jgi:thiol-disulfide isomerase/thioredoxin
VSTLAHPATQPAIAGDYEGTATTHGQSVPIHLKITGDGPNLKASLVNGTTDTPASSATFVDGHLLLNFSYFARTLDATLQDGALTGTFGGARGGFMPVSLHRGSPAPAPALDEPAVLGDWEIATTSSKGESAWQLRIAKSDVPQATLRAVIQRIDGDTGALYGSWTGDCFLVSHFTAAGPALYSIIPQPDGTLVVENFLGAKSEPLTARRPAEARKENLAPPTDTTQQTTIKDPNARFTFSFPDLTGKVVSNTDPQFDGKVVIVAIGGSWCPNCHDEAPLLESLYKQYHSKGLEIVNISFEEADQLKDPTRLRAFIARYGITYNVVLGSTTDQLNEKITQANNLNCWPTSFFLDRDGKVKEIHAGFAGPDNPAGNEALTHEVTNLVEHLLAEPSPTYSSSLTTTTP